MLDDNKKKEFKDFLYKNRKAIFVCLMILIIACGFMLGRIYERQIIINKFMCYVRL